MQMFWNKSKKNNPGEASVEGEGTPVSLLKVVMYTALVVVIVLYFIGVYWSSEPDFFEVDRNAAKVSEEGSFVLGYTTVKTTETIASTLLNKAGGYLSNDVLPPSVFLDNIPSWEFGVLVQVRDMASALRNHMSRSQSQSLENEYLKEVEPLFNNDHSLWILPSAESKYELAVEKLSKYRTELTKVNNPNSQFYARADNLNEWLSLVEKRLGGLSQRLTASVGQERLNTDLAGDIAAGQSTENASHLLIKTPWMEIDDVFYEARGACWALIHLLKAIEVDFNQVLLKKNAVMSLAQIVRELESTQESIWSPVILNGSGFGLMANHSLVMASYISRANAGLIDLRELLAKG